MAAGPTARDRARRFAIGARLAGSRALHRLRTELLRALVPKTLAATAAWLIARHVADHHEPFFAPIAAVVALNVPLGQRGANALRLVLGVVLGIVVGEITYRVGGGAYGTLAVATFVAMAIATAVGGTQLVVAQAAIGAILTVIAAHGAEAANRVEDALIGAGVALVFSQMLFSPEPVGMVRRVATVALRETSLALDLTAAAFEQSASSTAGPGAGISGDASSREPTAGARPADDLLAHAVSALRALRERFSEIDVAVRRSDATARHSAVWRWSRLAPLARARAEVAPLDMLGASCLVLARGASHTTAAERARLAPPLRELAAAIGDLSRAPLDPRARALARGRAEPITRAVREHALAARRDPYDAAAWLAVLLIATDVVAFAREDGARDAEGARDEGRVTAAIAPPVRGQHAG